jgi:release factor glutamine methyltransferase
MLKLRRNHYPVQYLLGKWYFRDLELTVKPPILIPRFETEHLIEISIEAIKSKWAKGSPLKFIDLGCGTGAIGLSLLKELSSDYDIIGTLLDLNPACVDLAK